MKHIYRVALLVASAAFFIVSASEAQSPGTVTNHAVPVGKGAGNTGFTSAAPGATGIPLTSNGASADPSFHPVTNAGIAPGAANTIKGSLDGATTSDLAIASCSAVFQFTQWISGTGWQCGSIPVLASRAVATTLNLSGFTAVTTLGYATPGDGGGGTFLNKTTSPFQDSFVTAISTTGNGTSGCTNGTYRGVQPTGGTGVGLTLTVTVSGNVVSAAVITGTGGNTYTASDSLSTTITGCSTTVTFSVSTVSSPTCSFSDTAGNHLQLIVDEGNFLNVKQCGAKVDRGPAGSDGAATNDWQSIQNALSFASYQIGNTFDGGGSVGQTVIMPHGTALFCNGSNSLLVPYGVVFRGQTATGSSLKLCDAGMDAASAPINVCDPNTHLACFGSKIQNMVIYANATPSANANVPMIFSNSIQQFDFLDTVFIYAGNRSCINYDTGYGGAAYVGMINVECTISSTNPGINLTNIGSVILKIKDSHVEAGGGGVTANGIQHSGGFIEINGLHTEGISTGIFTNVSTSTTNGAMRAINLTGGAHCTNLILKQAGSVASDLVVANAAPNGCTNTVNNGGSLTTTPVIANTTY